MELLHRTLEELRTICESLFNLLEGTVFDEKVIICPSLDASAYGMPFLRDGSFGASYQITRRLMYLTRFKGTEVMATFNAGSEPLTWFDRRELSQLVEYLEKLAGFRG